jgi:hypothetical protein
VQELDAEQLAGEIDRGSWCDTIDGEDSGREKNEGNAVDQCDDGIDEENGAELHGVASFVKTETQPG